MPCGELLLTVHDLNGQQPHCYSYQECVVLGCLAGTLMSASDRKTLELMRNHVYHAGLSIEGSRGGITRILLR